MSDDLTGSPGPNQEPDKTFQSSPELPVAGTVEPGPALDLSYTGRLPRLGGADNWPWWYALLTLAFGIVAVIFLVAAVAIVFGIAGVENPEEDATFKLVATFVQDIGFVLTAVLVAVQSGSVSLRDFGLVRAPFWRSVRLIAVVGFSYLAMLAIYNVLVDLPADNTTPDELGANNGTLAMLAFAVLVAMVAPFAEELLFRGVIFRALSNGIGVAAAAIVSGVLFGAIHLSESTTDRLLQVAALAVFGILLALLYTWSRTLWAPIALHATNNSLAVYSYAHSQGSDFGMTIAPIVWLLMMAICTVTPRLTDRPVDYAAQNDLRTS